MTHPLTLVHTMRTVRGGVPLRSSEGGTPLMAVAATPEPASAAVTATDIPAPGPARVVARPVGDRPAEPDAPAAGASGTVSDHDAPIAAALTAGPDHDSWAPRTSATGPDHDAGMSTVEYAVGTVVAAAFAAVLYRIVTGDSIVAGLTSLVQSALNTGF